MPAKTIKQSAKRQNVELARGINAIAANSLSKTNGRFKLNKKGGAKKVVAVKKASTKKWYPADYIPKPLPSAKTARNSVKTAKLRKSITPGTVLILLSGRFRGKRVVFLNQLESGLLLVTGTSACLHALATNCSSSASGLFQGCKLDLERQPSLDSVDSAPAVAAEGHTGDAELTLLYVWTAVAASALEAVRPSGLSREVAWSSVVWTHLPKNHEDYES